MLSSGVAYPLPERSIALDRLYDTVKREKGGIDVLFASAGRGEPEPLGQVKEVFFDNISNLDLRGTLFHSASPLFNDKGSIFMNGSGMSVKGFPGFSVYAGSMAALRSFESTMTSAPRHRKLETEQRHATGALDEERVASLQTGPHNQSIPRGHGSTWETSRLRKGMMFGIATTENSGITTYFASTPSVARPPRPEDT
ncbi:3-oxoacyl-[acyl-carrier protein] reductase [Acidisarcina polymorpha]|uniref:3-oxoacyl-[acyl-carrier protein] reductase n=1 Tax=Acidisarcina polymorpha TaxID=2211140 RepID=A0A2Z5FXJ2_9BACT|nr:3-oxoacyl-[acyl-carrier protein] reductase [Acidisarcina polymorpha]